MRIGAIHGRITQQSHLLQQIMDDAFLKRDIYSWPSMTSISKSLALANIWSSNFCRNLWTEQLFNKTPLPASVFQISDSNLDDLLIKRETFVISVLDHPLDPPQTSLRHIQYSPIVTHVIIWLDWGQFNKLLQA